MDEKTEKVYLRAEMTGHPIWRNCFLWEKAVLKTIRDEIRQNSPLKTMTKDEVTKYEHDVIYMRLNVFLTDLLFYELDKDVLKFMFTYFARSQKINKAFISRLLKKIDSFGCDPDEVHTF